MKGKGGCAQICTKKGLEAKCKCERGFALSKDDTSCTKLHPCDKKDNGGCAHLCNKDGDRFNCSCLSDDYRLEKDGKTCTKSK